MKKTAFMQALIIVILLSVSWMLLVVRIRKTNAAESTSGMEQTSGQSAHHDIHRPADSQDEPQQVVRAAGTVQNKQATPPAWSEWIGYLEQQQSARDMLRALAAMRDTVFSMDPEEGRARLLELITSGVNVQTGLRFQVGRGGALTGAPDLQTLLLDWLNLIDPIQAAVLAKASLTAAGDSLGPDAYVVHLRNYARGTTDPPLARERFVRDYFSRLITNPSWTSNPVHSIAESMDFAVYLGDGGIVPALSGFMASGQSPALGHAGSMAIERLVDIDPIGSVSAMIESIDRPGMSAYARAGFVARVDPADPQAFQLLNNYLQHPSVSRQEAITFLQFFPNMNKSLSHNLVSPEISITNLGNHMDRLQGALDAVHDWLANPPRSDINKALSDTEQRLLAQIKGEPVP